MKKILITVLTLLPLTVLSQIAVIGENNTVVLDELKTIEVANIIKNEERLRSEIEELHREILLLNDTIQEIVKINKRRVSEIESLLIKNKELQERINALIEKKETIIESRNDGGLYSMALIGSDFNNANSFIIGLSYVKNKMSYSAGIDPFKKPSVGKSINYYLGIGYKF